MTPTPSSHGSGKSSPWRRKGSMNRPLTSFPAPGAHLQEQPLFSTPIVPSTAHLAIYRVRIQRRVTIHARGVRRWITPLTGPRRPWQRTRLEDTARRIEESLAESGAFGRLPASRKRKLGNGTNLDTQVPARPSKKPRRDDGEDSLSRLTSRISSTSISKIFSTRNVCIEHGVTQSPVPTPQPIKVNRPRAVARNNELQTPESRPRGVTRSTRHSMETKGKYELQHRVERQDAQPEEATGTEQEEHLHQGAANDRFAAESSELQLRTTTVPVELDLATPTGKRSDASHVDKLDTSAQEPHMASSMTLATLRASSSAIFIGLVFLILFLGLRCLWLCVSTFTKFLDSLHSIEYRMVNWFDRSLEIEIALAAVPLRVLFDINTTFWKLPPTPVELDHRKDVILQPAWTWSMPAEFKPWLTTSSGVYVPEYFFLTDLNHTTRITCNDLRFIAAKPNSPSLYPKVESTCEKLSLVLEDTAFHHKQAHHSLEGYNDFAGSWNRISLDNMWKLLKEITDAADEDDLPPMGSDDDRIRWLWSQSESLVDFSQTGTKWLHMPTDTQGSYSQKESNSKNHRTPPVHLRGASSVSSSYDPEHTPPPELYAKAQTLNSTARFIMRSYLGHSLNQIILGPSDYSGWRLFYYRKLIKYAEKLEILHKSVSRLHKQVLINVEFFDPSFDGKPTRDIDFGEDFDDHFSKRALLRIFDVAEFLEIAIIRLREMDDRVKQGIFVLQKAAEKHESLLEEIDRVTDAGWVLTERHGWLKSRTVLYHLPGFQELVMGRLIVGKWLWEKACNMARDVARREDEFRSRQKSSSPDEKDKYRDWSGWRQATRDWKAWNQDAIYTRWSRDDTRLDPLGSQSFCWMSEEKKGVETDYYATFKTEEAPQGMFRRWWKWMGFDPSPAILMKYFAPSGCGDASLRHGDKGLFRAL